MVHILRTLILSFLFLLVLPLVVSAQTNRALFVGINKCLDSNWRPIHGADDRGIVTEMLNKNGYENKNITTLLNEAATKKNIMAALDNLKKQAAKGDYIYVHFSCHGQQIQDDNGDEDDGWDEALIPYDAEVEYKGGEFGRNHLRDDELEIFANEIRWKIGAEGNLVVVLDACHSGTGMRGGGTKGCVRGETIPYKRDGYNPTTVTNKGQWRLALKDSVGMATITVYSACRDNEQNSEYCWDERNKRYYGSLSYALNRLLIEKKSVYTGQSLGKALNSKVIELLKENKNSKEQTPFFESTDVNKTFKISR